MVERFSADLDIENLEYKSANDDVVVTPAQAQALSNIVQTTANVPTSVMVKAAQTNNEDGFLDALSEFFSKAKMASHGRLKKAVFDQFNVNTDTGGLTELGLKGAFLGVRALYENVIAEPLRTVGLAQQGMTYSEAYKKAQINPFTYWKEAGARGEKIDLGTALFQSTDPEKTQTYRDLIDQGADPLKARQYVTSVLGTNVFDKVFEQEKVSQFEGERAAALIARGKSPHITPGRVLFKPFEFIIGPDDRAYDFATGLFDLGLNFLDPTFMLGKGVKVVKGSRNMLNLGEEALDGLGMNNGFVRKMLAKTTVKEVMDGKVGDRLADFLYINKDKPDVIITKSNFNLVNKYVVNDEALSSDFTKFTTELFNLDSGLTVEAGRAAVKKILDKNLQVLAVATEGNIPQVQKIGKWRTQVQNYFGTLYQTKLSGRNPDNLIVQYTKFLKLLDPVGDVTNRSKRVKDMIVELDNLDTVNPAIRATKIINRVVDDFSDLQVVYRNELSAVGKLTEKNEKLIKDVFTVLQKVVEEQGSTAGNLAELNKLKGLPNGWRQLWRKVIKDGDDELTRGLTNETVDQLGENIFNNNILETTLTQDLMLQNPSKVIKLTNKLDASFNGKYKDALGIVGEMGVGRALDVYVGSIFKPLVLLRPAWTVRVIAEEQVRAVANGALGLLDHPIGLLARIFDDSIGVRGSYAKEGWLDTAAFKLGISDSTTGDVSRKITQGHKIITNNKLKYVPAIKKQNFEGWSEGQFRVLHDLHASIIVKKVAEIEINRGKKAGFAELEKLLTEPGEYKDAMQLITAGKSNLFRILSDDILESLTKDEKSVAIKGFITAIRNELKGRLSVDGKTINKELYEVIIRGSFKDTKGNLLSLDTARNVGAKQTDLDLLMSGDLPEKEAKKLADAVEAYEKNVRSAYAKKYKDVLPEKVDWKVPPTLEDKNLYDVVTENLFKFFMTNPTNKLSRIPVFKSNYWKKSEDLIRISTPEVQQQIVDGAIKAGLNTRTVNRLQKAKNAGANGINDAELIENLAKGFAVDSVKKLLYDITETRRFWEVSRWLFPFGNAYQEVLTTWAGIIKNNPQIAARGSQIWDGSTQPNDTFSDNTGKGFFYKNPVSGSVVFNYPGTDIVQDWMFDNQDAQTDVRVNMPVYASSLNIAAGLLPGFGPVIQVPAAFVYKNFPEEGFLTRILFGEFPPLNVNDPNEWTKALGLKPAWADKFIKLIFNQGENAQGVFGSTVIDTYKALLYSGQVDDSTEEAARKGMDKAVQVAQQLYLFRAVSQFIGPSGVASPIYELNDKNLDYFMFETLADEYRTIKASVNFDDVEATKLFIETYGINPLPLTVAKTVSIEKYPVTVEGADWMKKNMDIYDTYPLVAIFLEPAPVYAEFSYDAYKKSLLTGAREYRTPEQWQIAKNKLLGAVALDAYEREINIVGNNTQAARTLRNNKKIELEQRYWGYGQPTIVGSPAKPSIDMQIDQLKKMINDDSLQSFDTIQSAKKYFVIRQKIIDAFVAAGKSETIWKTSPQYANVRQVLRMEADKLIQENPKFGPMFDQLLQREFESEFEDNILVEL